MITQIVISGTIYFIAKINGVIYLIWVVLSYGTLGGHFSIFPTVTTCVFGLKYGGIIYSILFSAMPSSTMAGFVVTYYLIDIIGAEVFFFLSSALTCISAVLLYYFDEEPAFPRKEDIPK